MKRFCKTTAALFKKDLKDSLRNISMGLMLFLPPFFAFLLGLNKALEANAPSFSLVMVTAMCMTMIPFSYLATMIAEEKEKNTLRTLMLAGVSAGEFITSKILVVWLLMQIINIVDFFITGTPAKHLPWFLLATTFASVCLLMLGAVIGIVSRNQMSTSLLAVPLMVLMLIPTTMGMLSPALEALAEFSPIEHMMRLFTSWTGGAVQTAAQTAKSIIVILVWTFAAAIIYAFAYRKKRLDI